MAWTSGHTDSCTTLIPAAGSAVSNFVLHLTQADFQSEDRGSIADFLSAGQVEAATDYGGTSLLDIDIINVDTSGDTFDVKVGPITLSATAPENRMYWRFGASVTPDGESAYPASIIASWADGGGVDRSGGGYDGTGSGSPTFGDVAAPIGRGTNYDGSQFSTVFGSGQDVLAPRSTFSIEALVRLSSVTGDQRIFGRWGAGGNQCILWYDAGGANAGFAGLVHHGGNIFSRCGEDTASGTINTWHHVVLTFNRNGQIRIYVDGILVASASAVNSGLAASTQPTLIGGLNGAADFEGDVSGLTVYNTELTAAWVAESYAQQTAGSSESTRLPITTGGYKTTFVGPVDPGNGYGGRPKGIILSDYGITIEGATYGCYTTDDHGSDGIEFSTSPDGIEWTQEWTYDPAALGAAAADTPWPIIDPSGTYPALLLFHGGADSGAAVPSGQQTYYRGILADGTLDGDLVPYVPNPGGHSGYTFPSPNSSGPQVGRGLYNGTVSRSAIYEIAAESRDVSTLFDSDYSQLSMNITGDPDRTARRNWLDQFTFNGASRCIVNEIDLNSGSSAKNGRIGLGLPLKHVLIQPGSITWLVAPGDHGSIDAGGCDFPTMIQIGDALYIYHSGNNAGNDVRRLCLSIVEVA